MVDSEDPAQAESGPVRSRSRLAPWLALAVVVVGGLALFPSQEPLTSEQTPGVTVSDSVLEAELIGAQSRVGFIGLPPVGAPPSIPEEGELLLHYLRGGPREGWVYADGRVIRWWHAKLPEGANNRVTGLLERRLTPEGVELLLSEIPATVQYDDGFHGYDDRYVSLADPDGVLRFVNVGRELGSRLVDPDSWLPSGAWEDPVVKAYVPSRYEVCYLSDVVTMLPENIHDLLPAKDPQSQRFGSWEAFCSELGSENARAIVDALDGWLAQNPSAGGPGKESWYHLSYHINYPGDYYLDNLWFEPYLPHGEVLCSNCG